MVFRHHQGGGLCVGYHACSFLRNRITRNRRGDEGYCGSDQIGKLERKYRLSRDDGKSRWYRYS